MTTAMKCDFCAQPGVSLTGETNGVIVCIDHARTQDPLGIVTPNPRPTCPAARFGRPHVWAFGFWHEGEFIADEYVKCICGQIEWDAAWDAAGDAALRDLIGSHGFAQEHYDTLTGPWRKVIGPVHPDDKDL